MGPVGSQFRSPYPNHRELVTMWNLNFNFVHHIDAIGVPASYHRSRIAVGLRAIPVPAHGSEITRRYSRRYHRAFAAGEMIDA